MGIADELRHSDHTNMPFVYRNQSLKHYCTYIAFGRLLPLGDTYCIVDHDNHPVSTCLSAQQDDANMMM